MRIALITPGFSASEQDWCIPALLHLVRNLVPEHEVEIFALRYPHHNRTYQISGARVHAFGGAAAAGMQRLPLLNRVLTKIIAQGRTRPFDVIHALWADEPGFLAVLAGHILGARTVVSLMGGELIDLQGIGYGGGRSLLNRLFVAIALRYAASVTVGSQYLMRIAERYVAPAHLAAVPLGVDTKLFTPQGQPAPKIAASKGFHILHVGAFAPVKDHAMLLRAIASVIEHKPSARLHLVGEGALREELSRIVAALRLEQHVTFHGAVAHHELPAYYRAADLCALCSHYESQGLVVLEAAACARPVIGTAVGILPELQPPEQIVPVGDDRALAEALLRLMSTPHHRIALGLAARKQIEAYYTTQHTVKALVSLYTLWQV